MLRLNIAFLLFKKVEDILMHDNKLYHPNIGNITEKNTKLLHTFGFQKEFSFCMSIQTTQNHTAKTTCFVFVIGSNKSIQKRKKTKKKNRKN